MSYQSFENLEVWKKACRQTEDVFLSLKDAGRHSLRDQMERAAISVPSNIAEGQERDSIGDFIRFLRISKGSNAELRTQLYLAQRLGLIPPDKAHVMIEESKAISSMIQGLIRSMNPKP